jgi:hypothetical protein
MANWQSIENFAVPQAIDSNSTTQKNPLGTIIRARDISTDVLGTGEFIYLPGVASNAVGLANNFIYASYVTALVATGVATTILGPVAIAMSASVASEYGWYQISGIANIKTLASVAINKPLFPTATPGSLDDASLAAGAPESILQGCVTVRAIDSDGYSLSYISRPVIAGVNI